MRKEESFIQKGEWRENVSFNETTRSELEREGGLYVFLSKVDGKRHWEVPVINGCAYH